MSVLTAVPRLVVPRVHLHPSLWLPLLASVLNAALFLIIRPDVADLQAAYARGAATAQGVGLTYWFQWFGGGTTPGHYSIISPYLSSWFSAPLVGAVSTVAITLLLDRALTRANYQVAATWVGTITIGLSLWSGRIAFALGAALALVGLIGLLEKRVVVGALGAVGAVFASPVTGVFLGMGLFAILVLDREYRRRALALAATTAATLLFVAFYFGSPGPQSYPFHSAILVSVVSLFMLATRPAEAVRLVIWLTAIASPIIWLVPNGMGSNLARMPYICIPVAAIATATVSRRAAIMVVTPAIVICSVFSAEDLSVAVKPAAAADYYDTLAARLDRMPRLADYRLKIVQNRDFHTADFVLLNHAALATGWETQQMRALNPVLESETELNPTSYLLWLHNNAVGYVAFDHRSPDDDGPEYRLVAAGLDYLTPIWRDKTWVLYRVQDPTPIVPAPAELVQATQRALTIKIPCACTVPIRVRYSSFLTVTDVKTGRVGVTANDLTGWTTVTTPTPGTYRLAGRTI